jgi:hypothetical protein
VTAERRYRGRHQEAFFTGEPVESLDGLGHVERRAVYGRRAGAAHDRLHAELVKLAVRTPTTRSRRP